ncbi:uncharacterized protein AB675_4718 [Cyphellophora attinorum]|uniref:Riboflavin kinase n=1 Tax=Cyphellophora attinorum TaxID=1664694 RepID=A0A0N1H2U0_9EURO|nr:uncharacterized protein AB675_4718 [Phialophora attinorum]KPI38926.1 hypothetical protein AB675_4718 [Phialophora attinorum]
MDKQERPQQYRTIPRKPIPGTPGELLEQSQQPARNVSVRSEFPQQRSSDGSIPRKPLPISPVSPPPVYTESPTTLSAATTYSGYDDSLFDEYAAAESSARQQLQHLTVNDQPFSTSPTATPSLRSTKLSPNLRPELLRGDVLDGDPRSLPSSKAPTAAQKAGSAAVTAYQEARHFAGGLVSHPFEATKHYSILRHSHGLVFYSGSYTSIAITVFADRPLPPDRTFWLQRRGWSGKTGLRAGVLFGTHSAWMDVTPETAVVAEQVKVTDERAWQRDIAKFLRKAPKKLAGHVPRETAVLRVPCDAEDGYLRIVMCCGESGKKHLCPSPIFRLASTSLESSSLRGASLKTLPLEAAVKIGTAVGTKFVQTAAAPYVAAVKAAAVTQVTSVFQPSAVQVAAAQHVYDSSGVADRLVRMEEQWEARRDAEGNVLLERDGVVEPMTLVVGSDDGPAAPFPVRFTGKAMHAVDVQPSPLGFPIATVTNVDSNILLKHSGIFIGYVAITVAKSSRDESSAGPDPATLIDNSWRSSLISITANHSTRATVVTQKQVSVQLLDPLPFPYHETVPTNSKIAILLMTPLRPLPTPQLPATAATPEQQELLHHQLNSDAAIALATLSRPAWQAEPTLQRVKTAASQRSLTERYVDARRGVQEGVIDKVPTHLLGLRTDSHVRRDGFVGRGGFFVVR